MARSNNSLINYLSINENFPVAGQDNDTQVFRDNADTIKTSLRNAKDEITDILTNAAFLDEENNFELNNITNARLINNKTAKYDYGIIDTSPLTIEYQNGNYQILRVKQNPINVDFLNFPGDPVITDANTPISMGKVTLELYSNDGSSRTVNFLTSGGTVIKSKDFPGYAGGAPVLTLTSATDPVIIEVWRHDSGVIYMRYIGTFG